MSTGDPWQFEPGRMAPPEQRSPTPFNIKPDLTAQELLKRVEELIRENERLRIEDGNLRDEIRNLERELRAAHAVTTEWFENAEDGDHE
jgi:hypothetical protein